MALVHHHHSRVRIRRTYSDVLNSLTHSVAAAAGLAVFAAVAEARVAFVVAEEAREARVVAREEGTAVVAGIAVAPVEGVEPIP